MPKPYIIVEDGQSLYDISVQLFGHQDGVFDLLWDNPGLDHDALYPGQKLYYTAAVLDKDVIKYITQKNYVPATAGEMLDAPLPEPSPIGNAVLIHLYPDLTISLEAPTEYTVLPSKVVDEDDEIIQLLGPNQSYTIEAVEITNSLDVVLYELMPGEDQELPDVEAKNTLGTTIGTGPAGNPITVGDIEVTQADGSESDVPAGVDVECQFPLLHLVDTAGDPLGDISSYPVLGKIVAPDADVKLNGVHYGYAKAGGMLNVVVTASGIKYANPLQTHPTATSYATNDFAYNILNALYDRVHPAMPATYAEIDTAVGTSSFGYVLKQNNKWGHKFRFTGSTGGYYDASTAGWYTVAGASSTRATEVSNGVVQDHLTGKQYYDRGTGNWAGAIFSPASTIAGETGWLCPSIDDLFSFTVNKSTGSNNELNDAMPVNTVWSSNTIILTSANAWVLRALGGIVSHVSVAKTNTTCTRLVWKYFT